MKYNIGDKVEFWCYKRGEPGKEIKIGEVVKHNNIYQVRRDDTGFMFPIEWVTKVIEVYNE